MKKLNKILLVDDDETTNFYNKFVINKIEGVEEVLVALNGKEAIDLLMKEESDGSYLCPDLILLDINMPIMNGFEFLEAYKNLSEEYKANVIICMLTTSLHKNDVARVEGFSEVSDYLHKPLSEEKIVEIIEKHF